MQDLGPLEAVPPPVVGLQAPSRSVMCHVPTCVGSRTTRRKTPSTTRRRRGASTGRDDRAGERAGQRGVGEQGRQVVDAHGQRELDRGCRRPALRGAGLGRAGVRRRAGVAGHPLGERDPGPLGGAAGGADRASGGVGRGRRASRSMARSARAAMVSSGLVASGRGTIEPSITSSPSWTAPAGAAEHPAAVVDHAGRSRRRPSGIHRAGARSAGHRSLSAGIPGTMTRSAPSAAVAARSPGAPVPDHHVVAGPIGLGSRAPSAVEGQACHRPARPRPAGTSGCAGPFCRPASKTSAGPALIRRARRRKTSNDPSARPAPAERGQAG